MGKVLVTGGNGFTGKYLVEALNSEGHEVFSIGTAAGHGDRHFCCDLSKKKEVEDVVNKIEPEWVIHLAAISFVGHAHIEDFYTVNTIGTMNLLNALSTLRQRPRKVIVASSANVYGAPFSLPVNEDVYPKPINHYACSKLAMEHMASTKFDALPIIIVRPFNYTGPGQSEKFIVPKIVSHFAKGKKVIELGNLEVTRDFSDVRDVAKIYTRLLKSKARSETLNICSGEPISLASIMSTMELIAGYKIEVKSNPSFIRASDIKILVGDPSRLEGYIGRVKSYNFDQTLYDIFHYGSSRNQLSID